MDGIEANANAISNNEDDIRNNAAKIACNANAIKESSEGKKSWKGNIENLDLRKISTYKFVFVASRILTRFLKSRFACILIVNIQKASWMNTNLKLHLRSLF